MGLEKRLSGNNNSHVYAGDYMIVALDLGYTFNYAEMSHLNWPQP